MSFFSFLTCCQITFYFVVMFSTFSLIYYVTVEYLSYHIDDVVFMSSRAFTYFP